MTPPHLDFLVSTGFTEGPGTTSFSAEVGGSWILLSVGNNPAFCSKKDDMISTVACAPSGNKNMSL
jgi:hypothetical protein